MERESLAIFTADIVSAHVANNKVAIGDIGPLVKSVFGALAQLQPAAQQAPEARAPLVSAKASVKPDFIACMSCGKKQKTLRRHLMTAHGLSPDQYRQEYGLPQSYPMVAPNYSQRRRELAQAIGLGRTRGAGRARGSSS